MNNMIQWNNGVENLNDKFRALPADDRKQIVNYIVNVAGLSCPRPKSWKEKDQELYGKPRNFARLRHLFEIVASKHILKSQGL